MFSAGRLGCITGGTTSRDERARSVWFVLCAAECARLGLRSRLFSLIVLFDFRRRRRWFARFVKKKSFKTKQMSEQTNERRENNNKRHLLSMVMMELRIAILLRLSSTATASYLWLLDLRAARPFVSDEPFGLLLLLQLFCQLASCSWR